MIGAFYIKDMLKQNPNVMWATYSHTQFPRLHSGAQIARSHGCVPIGGTKSQVKSTVFSYKKKCGPCVRCPFTFPRGHTDTPDSARRSRRHVACGSDDEGWGRGACPRGTGGVRTCRRHSRDVLRLQGVRCQRRANQRRFGGPHRARVRDLLQRHVPLRLCAGVSP